MEDENITYCCQIKNIYVERNEIMAREKNFENRIKIFLQSLGIYPLGTPVQKMKVQPIGYYEKRWGSKMTKKGLPDLHVVVNTTSLEFELKAPDGRASELQKKNIEQINRSKCLAAVAYEHKEDIPDDGFKYYISYEQLKDTVMYYASQSQ